jgi:hypothetical protein
VVVAGTGGAVVIEGQVEARGVAAGQRGGTVEVVADRVQATATARVDASGTAGGGEIAFGTTRQGSAAPRRASQTSVAAGAALRADATVLGQGGRVEVNSTDRTDYAGATSARGGPQGGDGGFIEVSGKNTLRITGGTLDPGAPAGRPGQVLLDPLVAVIGNAGDPPGDADNFIDVATINSITAPLTVQADNRIDVNAAINILDGDGSLTLTTGGALNVNASIRQQYNVLTLIAGDALNINAPVTSDFGNLFLRATSPAGAVTIGGALRADGGTLDIRAGGNITFNSTADAASLVVLAGGSITVNAPLSANYNATLRGGGDMLLAAGSDPNVADPFGSYGGDMTAGIQLHAALSAIRTLQTDPPSPPSGLIRLQAGTGGITQSGTDAALLAAQLQVNTTGDALLTGGKNAVDTLGTSNVTGNLSFAAAPFTVGSSTINLAGAINVGGTLDVTTNGASLVQNDGSVITAARLNAAVTGGSGITLDGANQVATLGTLTAPSTISFTNATSLVVDGAVRVIAPQIRIIRLTVTSGDLTLAGTIDASQGGDTGFGFGSLTLNVAGNTVQTGGQVLAGQFQFTAGGAMRLDGGANAIGVLASSSAGGDFVLDNGSNDLEVFGVVTAANIGIRTGGQLMIAGGESTLAGAVFGLDAGTGQVSLLVNDLVLSGDGTLISGGLVEIAPFTPRPVQIGVPADQPVPDGIFGLSALQLTGIAASDTLRIGGATFNGALTTTATSVEVVAPLQLPVRLDLRSLGTITQRPDAPLNVLALSGAAGTSVTLTNPDNSIGHIDDFSAGTDFALTAQSVNLRGAVSAGATMTLTSATGIQNEGNGSVAAGKLHLLAQNGSVNLSGANQITRLGASSSTGDFILVNAGPQIEIPAGEIVQAPGTGSITATTGAILVNGTIRTARLTLAAPSGTVTVNGHSAIAFNGQLALQAQQVAVDGLIAGSTGITVDAAQSASFAGIADTPDLRITTPSVSFADFNATAAAVRLLLGGGGTATGAIDAGTLDVADGAGATLTGTIAGIADGPAAARGTRSAGGVTLGDPPPDRFSFLFNDCPIGAASCARPQPPIEPEAPSLLPDLPIFTVADNPHGVLDAIDPAGQPPANPLVTIPTLPLTTQPGRDTTEDRELAPPNVRAEDF